MELIIKGEPKEIADLVVALQGQQKIPVEIKTTLKLDGATLYQAVQRANCDTLQAKQ